MRHAHFSNRVLDEAIEKIVPYMEAHGYTHITDLVPAVRLCRDLDLPYSSQRQDNVSNGAGVFIRAVATRALGLGVPLFGTRRGGYYLATTEEDRTPACEELAQSIQTQSERLALMQAVRLHA